MVWALTDSVPPNIKSAIADSALIDFEKFIIGLLRSEALVYFRFRLANIFS